LLFVILFGLSIDYHVFIISLICEAFRRGDGIDDAIAHGIKSTAGVVTSAATVMVCVFAIFGTLSMLMFKQFGVGPATAQSFPRIILARATRTGNARTAVVAQPLTVCRLSSVIAAGRPRVTAMETVDEPRRSGRRGRTSQRAGDSS
jgi:hypothetical protein